MRRWILMTEPVRLEFCLCQGLTTIPSITCCHDDWTLAFTLQWQRTFSIRVQRFWYIEMIRSQSAVFAVCDTVTLFIRRIYSQENMFTQCLNVSHSYLSCQYGPCWLENAFVMGSEKFSDTTWFENTRLLVPPINRIIKTKCERWRFLVILIKSFIGDFVSGLILWVASIEMWRQTNKVHSS